MGGLRSVRRLWRMEGLHRVRRLCVVSTLEGLTKSMDTNFTTMGQAEGDKGKHKGQQSREAGHVDPLATGGGGEFL